MKGEPLRARPANLARREKTTMDVANDCNKIAHVFFEF
jgi:hypothetical protein